MKQEVDGYNRMNKNDSSSFNIDTDSGVSTISGNEIKDGKQTATHENHVNGIKVFTAVIFVIGEMAGSGVIALPKAVVNLGVVGFVLMVVCCFLAAYTGTILGKCWTIIQERHSSYRSRTRDPYPAIAFVAYGKPGRIAVSISNNVTLFGVGVVFLLLSSEITADLISNSGLKVSSCYWLLIIAGVLTPFTWLGSPKDMWFLAVGAASTTLLATVLIVINLLQIQPQVPMPVHTNPDQRDSGFTQALLGFGTIVYAFGNHSVLPTVQHDMKRPKKFTTVVYSAFLVVLLMYTPVSAIAYLVFGDSVDVSILTSIQNQSAGPILFTVQSLLGFHLLFGFVILVNPVCQEVENSLNVPHRFCWKRVLVRTLGVCCMVFVAESIPKFGSILSLIGGSTISMLSFIFPIVFYIRLCRMKGPWKERKIPLHQYVLFVEILILGTITIVAATYSAIIDIVSPNTFVLPCYINPNLTQPMQK
ncbi:uncharacterized protein LOC141899538 isoform X1 [Tubulanus polymorphus]|uniref:uncharacterized protein LOC141899538 isoform X1 n=1 Tax=Tubulanus polymorphus TaxID=672921 RepID=UPI003DA32A4B